MGRYKIIRTWHLGQRVDQDFYNQGSEETTLIDPVLTLQLSGTGSLEFTMPRTHKYFYKEGEDDEIMPMGDEFMVVDTVANKTLFVGRPISCKTNDFKSVSVYCEGALAYLHDILIRPVVWDNVTPKAFFRDILAKYNAKKTQHAPWQTVQAGSCDIPDRTLYRYANYDKAYDLISKGCLESEGGYLLMSYGANGEKILNWYKSPPQSSRQKLVYGKNIVRYNEDFDLSEMPTDILPLGAASETEELPGDLGKKKLTLSQEVVTVNEADIHSKYGYVETLKEYSDATTEIELLATLRNDQSFKNLSPKNMLTIDCQVVDYHFVDDSVPILEIGQKIVLQTPYQIYKLTDDRELYITEIRYNIGSAAPEIRVSNLGAQTLTDQFKRVDKGEKDSRTSSGGGGSYGGGGDVTKGLYIYLGQIEPDDPFPEDPNQGIEGNEGGNNNAGDEGGI